MDPEPQINQKEVLRGQAKRAVLFFLGLQLVEWAFSSPAWYVCEWHDAKHLIKPWPLDLSTLFRLDCEPMQNQI